MRFFSNLFDTGCPGKTERETYRQQIAELERLFGIGEYFAHVGVRCVVIGHSVMIPTLPTATKAPQLCYEYADNAGVIRQGALAYEVAKAVIRSDSTPGAQSDPCTCHPRTA